MLSGDPRPCALIRAHAAAFLLLAPAPLLARAQPAADPAGAAAQPLDPGSPMRPLPDLGVAWPDLAAAPADTPPTRPAGAAPPADPAASQRYAILLQGTEALGIATLRASFDAVSVLVAGEGKPANLSQIDRRARDDGESLRELLRAEGYYDAEVDTRIEPDPAVPGRLRVVLDAEPGQPYHFTEVALPGIENAGADAPALREAFGVRAQDPVDADKVAAAIAALKAKLGERGYVFAKVAEPDIVVDHDTRGASLVLAVDPAGARRFGRIVVRGSRLFGAGHISRIARLHPGERFDARRLDDLRRALINTGLVSTVQLTPVPTADPHVADLVVRLDAAPPRTIAGELGYGTGEGARLEISWQHRNLLPPEGAVTFRGVAGTQEQLLSAQLRRANFRSRDEVLNAQIELDHQHRAAYDAKTFTLAAGIARETNIIWQKKWTWSYGGELDASDERDVIAATGAPRRRTYLIAAAPTSLAYDGSDDLLNPTRGHRLSGRLSPELSLQNGVFGYAKLQIDGSYYQPVGRAVLAGRLRFGSILGATADRIAPTRRFYSGGGGSVRGYGYQDIGPRDIDNDPIGGRSLAEFAVEARVRFGNFGVVPFLDGGNLYASTLPRFTGFRYGAGLGARYYTNFGPIRVDVGTPINRQKGDARVAVYVSLGQAF